jgi:Tol biopolymer transport system component
MKYLFPSCIIYLLIGNVIICFSQGLPIKPTRAISFTTDVGSHMDIDVSPDGKYLVFDLLGDLYMMPVTGGKAVQITRGIALNTNPKWSPDGKKIAYMSDFSGAWHVNVIDLSMNFHWVLDRKGNEYNHITDGAIWTPIWTPDGNYIQIGDRLLGVSGGTLSSEVTVKNTLQFSSDGRCAYTIDSGKLFKYNLNTKVRTEVAPVLKHYIRALPSPDGHYVAYLVDPDTSKDHNGEKLSLVLQDLATGKEQMAVPELTAHRLYVYEHFAFSPDSKDIYIGYGGKVHRVNTLSGNDKVIPFTADIKTDLGPLNYNTFRVTHDSLYVKYTRSANASPDGKHLVFSALDRLYSMTLPNGKASPLAPQPVSQYQPVYSPDGKWIAYVSWCDTAGGQLWRVPSSGGKPEQLTKISGQYQRPAWSPDGKSIAVIRGVPELGDRDDAGIGRLELIMVDGSPIKAIADSIPLWNQLAFSPDGHKILFTPSRPRDLKTPLVPKIVSRDMDGNNQQVVAVGNDEPFYQNYQQKTVSPDGRYIVYSADEDLYLVPVNKLTQPTAISDDKQQLSVIRFSEGVDPCWERGGKVLAWSYGNHFYRINPDKIIAAAEALAEKNESLQVPEKDFVTTKVSPDDVINMKVTLPREYGHGTIALKDVRIITMEDNKVIEHGTIVIKDGRFTVVGAVASTFIPRNAKTYSLPGATVMPGLVDLHLHMRVPSNIFPQQSWMFLVNLAYGVTTARDPSISFDSFGYTELLASGQMIGPRLYTVGRAVRLPDGVMRFDDLEDARRVIQKRFELGGSEVKQYELPARMQRQWLLMACRDAGLNMTNEGAGDLMSDLGMIKDGSAGLEHNPRWGDAYKDLTTFFAKSGTFFTPTLQVGYAQEAKEYFDYKYWHYPDHKLAHFTYSDTTGYPNDGNGANSFEAITKWQPKDTTTAGFIYAANLDAQIRKQGGQVTLGSHGNDEGIGPHNELWALQMGGLTNMQALQAGTIMGAEALGIQKDVGSIEVGKIADLIILNKNPLDDIHNSREIKYVMKDGVLYDGNTLDEIWPLFKKCPEWKMHNQLKDIVKK